MTVDKDEARTPLLLLHSPVGHNCIAMTQTDYLIKFAESFEIENGRFSCLKLALDDARKLAGRNPENGNEEKDFLETKNSFLNPYSYIGIINYLLILELIGEVFHLKGFTSRKDNKIYLAFKQFDNTLSDNEIDAIISLRNCLAHNYGLVNIPNPSEFSTKLHRFVLLNNRNTFIIKFPSIPWDCIFSNDSDSNLTAVSVPNLIELIEKTYSKLLYELHNNNVTLKLNNGVDELKRRFTITF